MSNPILNLYALAHPDANVNFDDFGDAVVWAAQRIRELEAENKRLTAELIDAMEDVMNYTLNKRIGQLEKKLESVHLMRKRNVTQILTLYGQHSVHRFVDADELEALLNKEKIDAP